MKNNKITDIGNLPQYWPNIERLYLGTNLINTIPFEIGSSLLLLLLLSFLLIFIIIIIIIIRKL